MTGESVKARERAINQKNPMKTHTPGPWIAKQNKFRGLSVGIIREEKTNQFIADCRTNDPNEIKYGMRSVEEIDANARLIAAAPELLEAMTDLLADVLNLLEKNSTIKLGTMGIVHIVKAKEAIKKAKGEAMKEHEIRIQLGKCLLSQGIGSQFSKALERKIISLRKQLEKI